MAATIPTLSFSDMVIWPPNRCVFRQHVVTIASASLKTLREQVPAFPVVALDLALPVPVAYVTQVVQHDAVEPLRSSQGIYAPVVEHFCSFPHAAALGQRDPADVVILQHIDDGRQRIDVGGGRVRVGAVEVRLDRHLQALEIAYQEPLQKPS